MRNCIGIRRENKYLTEKRAPLSPYQVMKLINLHGLHVVVEPSDTRIFSNDEYEKVGAEISEDLSNCNIVFGIKEIPVESLEEKMAYCFFSHTIKGQPYNMPMLKKILDQNCTLLDYELVTDQRDKRVIFFGNFAGYAGIINSMWALGKRLQTEGVHTPFANLQQTCRYESLDEAKRAVGEVAERIKRDGLPDSMVPFVCGFTGYGQVSKGAQDMYELLPSQTLTPEELPEFFEKGDFSRYTVYKVVFKEEHMFAPKPYQGREKRFNLREYFSNPERYFGTFHNYVPYLTMVINGIYWTPKCPKLITKEYLKEFYQQSENVRLKVIGDISCDIDGSIEMTVKATSSDNPVYVFDPETETVQDGFEGRGPVVMAVDKLPAELPRESSEYFGGSLMPFVPELADADFFTQWDRIRMPREFRKAMIVHRGKLTRSFNHLQQSLPKE